MLLTCVLRAVQRSSSDKKPGRTERKRQASRKRRALLDILERVTPQDQA
jgi:hypothetical protein